ncbi:galactofuranosyltransferase [Dysgonomonas sp. ZJ279]|uniref:galactofuranosyltransferase n=1 Tax=Dysgonomonas sp. ZJ279 TaxID=2709796 RepID=UPI0013EACCFD|nr:galactofuranosyltransferase [Dysgonomonas sp. ZJ279]
MNKCYLSKNYKGLGSAGNKAKTDIEAILKEIGYRNVGLKQSSYDNKIIGFLVTLLGVLKTPFSLRKGDILVLQYPLKKYYELVCNIAHMKGCKVVTIIHDLGSFRRGRLTIEQEIERLNHSDYIIAHNEAMAQWLQQHKTSAQIGCLQIFDYLSKDKAQFKETAPTPYSVVYAGALSSKKNAFLYELGNYMHSYRFNLYGGGFDASSAKNEELFTYKGFIPSDELITSACGHFGLVWDGDSTSTCSGTYGEYLQYNNPHKTSLYIRCLLPVIIWKKAALAPFIKENNIGICIDSLENLDEVLSSVSQEEYETMKKNIVTISDRLSTGYYLTHAVDEAYQYFKK